MNKACKGFCFWILLLLFPLHAGAYVPESSLLVELMLESMGNRGKMSMEVQRSLPLAEGEAVPIEEKFLFNIPGVFRSETLDGKSFWLASAVDDFLLVHGAKRFTDSKPRLEDYFYAPMLLQDKEILLRFLQRRGVDITRSGLAKHGGKICYRLGDARGSRLLLDKESFYPLFLILEERVSGITHRVEIQYRNWQGEKGSVFPGEVDILDGEGLLLQEIRIKKLAGNVFADSLMNFEALKKRYPLSEGETRSPRLNPEPSDPLQGVEDSLDRFRRRYE
ncbi:hypothetical protein LJC24_01990 [Desulfococcaceae bacterium OttesenSCG-928-F15]|nr:hypothetical protein [Desulfococcaceae bacterium OttesenSCG-928-F15]